jgi:uncharacterized protein (DUF433 family)
LIQQEASHNVLELASLFGERFAISNGMAELERITITPGIRSGKPCIRGTRMTVSDVLEYLAGGMTEAEILDDFPELTREDILACLAFAAERERRIVTLGTP